MDKKKDLRTAVITISTLLGLFFAYSSFLYIKSVISFQEIRPGGSWLSQGSTQNSLSWNIDKIAFTTVCWQKGGRGLNAIDFFTYADAGISCNHK